MKIVKRAVITMVFALACAGIYGALRSLPVVSGCEFYSNCPQPAVDARAEAEAFTSTRLGASTANVAP